MEKNKLKIGTNSYTNKPNKTYNPDYIGDLRETDLLLLVVFGYNSFFYSYMTYMDMIVWNLSTQQDIFVWEFGLDVVFF